MATSGASWSRRADAVPAWALALVAVSVFLLAWALLHHGFYARDAISDLPVYERYGRAIAEGQMPYRDFRPEYPPLALLAFAVPALAEGGEGYRRVFELLMALSGAAAVGLVALTLALVRAPLVRAAVALALVSLAPLLLGSVVLSRFDLWPAALTAGALAALAAGRDRLGSGVLGLAVAAKLYPAVLGPLALAWVWRRRGRREALIAAGIFGAAALLPFLPFLLVAPEGVAASLARQLSRPLQIESLGAAVLLALRHPFGFELEMASGHGSQNVAGTAGAAAGIVSTLVQLAVLAWVWLRFARGPAEPERLLRFAAAAVLAFVALGKVLSPQFLVWLVPLVPLVAGRRGLAASGLLGVALVLTQLWFPYRYWDYAHTFDDTVAWLVLARDLALVAALGVLVRPRRLRD